MSDSSLRAKRKAQDQITPNSTIAMQPVTQRQRLQQIGWSGLAYLWYGLITVYTLSVTVTHQIHASNYIQTEIPRQSGTSAVKRQRTGPSNAADQHGPDVQCDVSNSHDIEMPDAAPMSFYAQSPRRRMPGEYPQDDVGDSRSVQIRLDTKKKDQSPKIQLCGDSTAFSKDQIAGNEIIGQTSVDQQHINGNDDRNKSAIAPDVRRTIQPKIQAPGIGHMESQVMRLALHSRRRGDIAAAPNHDKFNMTQDGTGATLDANIESLFAAPQPALMSGKRFEMPKARPAVVLPSYLALPAQTRTSTQFAARNQPAAPHAIAAARLNIVTERSPSEDDGALALASARPAPMGQNITTAHSDTLAQSPTITSQSTPAGINDRTKNHIDPTSSRAFRLRPRPHSKKSPEKVARKASLDHLLLETEDSEKENLDFLPTSQKKTKERVEQAKRRAEREEKERAREALAKKEAAKKNRLTRRNPITKLIQPLTADWNNKIDVALRLGVGERAASKFVSETVGGTALHVADFQKLLGRGQWLNDEVINGYVEWVVDAANKAANAEGMALGEKPSAVPKFIAQNSFFYNNLAQKGPEATTRLMKRKKVVGVDFMQVDTMFIPVNNGLHWTLGVVRPVAKTIEYFDSMGARGDSFVERIRLWLEFQLGNDYVKNEWTAPHTGCAVQNNSHDCGVFLCTNALCVALGLDTTCYYEKEMLLQRRRIAAVMINRGFSGDFAWGTGY